MAAPKVERAGWFMDCKIVRSILMVFREPVSTSRQLLEALDQPIALEAGQSLDPEQAVELIDLVLVANRAQALRFLGLNVAVDILIADPHARMPLDVFG